MDYSHELCSAALCPDPVDIDNGMVTFTGNSVGDTATYTCDSGFELIGSATTTCTRVDANSAVLQLAPPSCRREYSECTAKCKDFKAKGVFHRKEGSQKPISLRWLGSRLEM